MATESAIWLHSLAVVVMAKYHNTSILNKDFLARRGIVPDSWTSVETITTLPVSVIKYSNGVQWMVDQDRLIITEACDRPFQQNEDSMVHDRASLYVEALPHTPYTALGLNYTASIIHDEPEKWITRQFLNKAFHSQELAMQPRFTMNAGDATLKLNFRPGNMNRGNESHKSVIIHCSIHYSRGFDSDALKTKISEWKKGKDIVHSKLVTMVEVH